MDRSCSLARWFIKSSGRNNTCTFLSAKLRKSSELRLEDNIKTTNALVSTGNRVGSKKSTLAQCLPRVFEARAEVQLNGANP